MELSEKLQQLRKQQNLTQEELAHALYVSRAAISKWESGRGYPSIDSLKAIADYFGLTVDELICGNDLLMIAKEDKKKNALRFRDLVFGLLDISVILLFFLPFFAQRTDGTIEEVSLFAMADNSVYLRVAYFALVIALNLWGILVLSLQNADSAVWSRCKCAVSLLLNAAAALVFIISLQPYAAIYLFVFFMIKVLVLLKR